MSKVIKLESTAFWCDPHRKNKFGNIQMEACRLNPEQVKALKNEGVKIGFDTENEPGDENFKGHFVKLKADNPVPITDMEGNPLPSNLFIGNGSVVIAGVLLKNWVHKESSRSGVKLKWLNGKVKEFVAYDPDASAKAKADQLLDEESGGGFVFGGEDGTPEADKEDNTTDINNDLDEEGLFDD